MLRSVCQNVGRLRNEFGHTVQHNNSEPGVQGKRSDRNGMHVVASWRERILSHTSATIALLTFFLRGRGEMNCVRCSIRTKGDRSGLWAALLNPSAQS